MYDPFYSSLPEKYLSESDAPQIEEPYKHVQQLLTKELPSLESKNLNNDLQWSFLLDKHASAAKKQKPIRKKRTFLTRKERKELNVLKLPKTEWDYGSLGNIRRMWRQYMQRNLDLNGSVPSYADPDWSNFSLILAKSELIGSEIKVVRSRVPSHVGLQGTVVLETKMTLQIVTPTSQLKIIPKNTSVFEFALNNLKFTIFGKHIVTKPSERSVKKIKSQMLPDL